MPKKLGNGGEGLEEFNPNDGQYIEDGIPNKSYDNPEEEKAMELMGLDFHKRKQYPSFGKKLYKKYNYYDAWDADSGNELFLEEANKIALNDIIIETGYSLEEAEIFHNNLKEYFGGDYKKFKKNMGYDDKISIIDEGLKRMSPYDGKVYRGLSFNKIKDNEKFDYFLKNLKIGNVMDMGGISSWSSSKKVATGYADLNDHITGKDYNSIVFTVSNNKTGIGMQHISKFGSIEGEVTYPSDSKWKITNIKTKNKDSFGYDKQIIFVELEEL